eukprot:4826387-Pleurochrysis_carterae.AAC.1
MEARGCAVAASGCLVRESVVLKRRRFGVVRRQREARAVVELVFLLRLVPRRARTRRDPPAAGTEAVDLVGLRTY